ncbi:MAG: DedA family protein [Candidatus Micrarchaeota archaeon]
MIPFLTEIEAYFWDFLKPLILSLGGPGIMLGMFLESSIVPIPSELILVTAGLMGFSPIDVAIWGTIGSTLGAAVGYYIGKLGGRPVVDKIGPYLFVTNDRVLKAEQKFKKYGGWTILVSRLIPFIPFKVFSITSGILKFDFKTFIAFTFIGTIPRAFLLAWVGTQIMAFKEQAILLMLAVAVIGLVAYYLNKRRKASLGL